MNYEEESKLVVEKLMKTIRNKPDLEQQKLIIAAFPFHKSNSVAWKAYAKEVNKQRGGRMFGV